ncbi:hypothetical protein LU293_07800 [Moraxella nasovis]|uniref:hypothetical protein n=1 Tax=Moraxella nasovis TaxID=2904121 RepID=UPI001F617E22|nr:hypothetical protein [Moraxella nasovis]UNU72980.1 hypothetical protein LU293_07800 [Moraxella nasovis]
MTDVPDDMDGKVSGIHQDGFSVLDECHESLSSAYPISHDFDDGILLSQHLPIILIALVFGFNLINTWIGLFYGNGDVIAVLIISLAFVGVFGFGLYLPIIHFIMWRHHKDMLVIDKDHLACILKFSDKQKTVISFERIYHIELKSYTHTWQKLVLYHISFSDDGQFYKKHKNTIGYVSGFDKQKSKQILSDITHAMLTYHANHQVCLPKINRIRQR